MDDDILLMLDETEGHVFRAFMNIELIENLCNIASNVTIDVPRGRMNKNHGDSLQFKLNYSSDKQIAIDIAKILQLVTQSKLHFKVSCYLPASWKQYALSEFQLYFGAVNYLWIGENHLYWHNGLLVPYLRTEVIKDI